MELPGNKHRYVLLDGLRGVAALFVIFYHFGEAFATSPVDQWVNHGYLAVDFFFILSGFVIGQAYDKRWTGGLTAGNFMLRRVIRLQPMVVLAVMLGGFAYLIQGSVRWDGTPMSTGALLLSLFLGLFMLPAIPGTDADVRGNNEMFPLNGPSWSLFFEYIGSFLYAIWLHRLSVRTLLIVVCLSAAGLAFAVFGNLSGYYHIGVGWSLCDYGFWGGFIRMSFSFSIGLLMARRFKPKRIGGAFGICSVVLGLALSMPYVGAGHISWLNGCYDLLCALFIFPAIVYIGAGADLNGRAASRICEFLGRLSYPVYIVHYPLMYIFYAWVWSNGLTFGLVWPVCILMVFAIILIAWLACRYYETPVRAWLSSKVLNRKK